VTTCCNTDADCSDTATCTIDTCDTALHTCVHRLQSNCCEPDAGGCDAGSDAGDATAVHDASSDTGHTGVDAGNDAAMDVASDRGPEGGLESGTRNPGCGCAVPGGTGRTASLAPALFALAMLVRRRRRGVRS